MLIFAPSNEKVNKNMIATIDFCNKWFPIYNKEYFDGELPTPKFELIKTKTTLGEYQHCNRLDIFGNPLSNSIFNDGSSCNRIRMSIYYDRPERDLQETLIHEMIHFYVDFKKIIDNGSHGKEWKKLAEAINKKGGWTISRTTSTLGCAVNPLFSNNKTKAYLMAYKVGCMWQVSLLGEKMADVCKPWLIKNQKTYYFGEVERTKFPHFSLCRSRVLVVNKDENYVNDVVLPNLKIILKN